MCRNIESYLTKNCYQLLFLFFAFVAVTTDISAAEPCQAIQIPFKAGDNKVPCGSAANTVSNLSLVNSGSTFDLQCLSDAGYVTPAEPAKVGWYTMIVQPGGSYEWQIVETGGDDVYYEIYYYNGDPTVTALNAACMGTGDVSGDLLFYQCGSGGFSSWELLGTPDPLNEVRFFFAVYKIASETQNNISFNLKFRRACGEGCVGIAQDWEVQDDSECFVVGTAPITFADPAIDNTSPPENLTFTYLWTPDTYPGGDLSNGQHLDAYNIAQPTFSTTTPGVYTYNVVVQAIDPNGTFGLEYTCPQIATVTVIVYDGGSGCCTAPVTVSIIDPSPVCEGDGFMLAANVANAGLSPTYEWTTPYGPVTAMTISIADADPSTHSGEYCLTVTSDAGCFSVDCIDIEIIDQPMIASTTGGYTHCAGDPAPDPPLGLTATCPDCPLITRSFEFVPDPSPTSYNITSGDFGTISASGFPTGSTITNIKVNVEFEPLDGVDCAVPGTGATGADMLSMSLTDGVNPITLISNGDYTTGSFNPDGSPSPISVIFEDGASFINGTEPSSGTFDPSLGNLSGYYTTDPNSLSLTLSIVDGSDGNNAGAQEAVCVYSFTVEVTASPPAEVVWFDAVTGGNQVGTGSPFFPTLTPTELNTVGTTTYYVECDCGDCASVRTGVDLVIEQCCEFLVECPTFTPDPTVVSCYNNIPKTTIILESIFESLGMGDGVIGDDPCGIIEITASNTADPGCEGSVTRTYTITEYADVDNDNVKDDPEVILNTTTCIQDIVVEREDFSIGTPDGSSNVQCITEVSEPTPPVVTDGCSNELTPSAAVVGGTFDGCSGTRTYTFTFTDCELNSHDWVFTYNINDNTAPTWDAAACANIGASALTTITADASCQQTMPDLRGLALAELTENCDVLVATDITQSPAPGSPLTPPAGFDGCGPAGAAVYTIDVTFNVTDCNGNPAAELSCDALVTVEDNTAPTWDAAACANIGASALTTITADASCQQTMPDLRGLALAELTENCDVLVATDITQSPAPGSPLTPPAGFDGCGPAGAAVYTIDVTFNVTDCNGNPAAELSCDALVTVEDNTAPTWDAAACTNIGASALTTITADASCQQTMPDLRGLALAELTENCDVLVATDITQSPAPGSPLTPPAGFDGCGPAGAAVYTIDVTFNVTDCNGNPAAELSCDALVTVEDNTAPTWDAAACANIGASALTTITADASCQQTMPDLRGLALAELTENCDVLVATDITQSPAPGSPLTPPAGFDGCGPAGAAVYTIDVTFNVTDCNGNPAAELSCDALVTVEDNTAPTWDAAACANIGASALTTITADASCQQTMPDLRGLALAELTENCDVLVATDITQSPAPGSPLTPPAGFDGCGPAGAAVYTIDVTFNVTDCNGNPAAELSCDALVTVEDNTAPTWDAAACANIGASALTTITADASCQQTMPDLRGLALAELTENCDVLVATDITQSPAPGSPLTPPAGFDGCGPAGAAVYTIDVTFNVTDCNGNPAAELSCDALVTVEDNTAPTWDAAACANIGASALTTITADASCQQTMPDLRGLALAELTENCDVLVATDITQSPAPGSPLTPPAGFDGCGPAGAAVYTIDVTFNVTDCNGNPAAELSCDALVTVEDNTAPTWDAAACANIGASALTTITADASCQQTMPDLRGLALAELTENCDVLVATDITQSPAPGSPLTPPAGFDGCGPAGAAVYTIDVTFNVTDCNGNPAAELSCDALVTVEDNTAPTWDAAACANIGASALTTITADASCQQTMPDLRGLALAELTENCDVLVATDITQSPAPGSPLTPPAGFDGCGPAGAAVYTIDVTFNVTDCNGNPAAELSCDALVTVEDNTAPTWDAAACANIGASALTTITADASCQQTMPDLRGLALAELTENCDVLVATDITQSPAPGSPLTPPAGFDGCGPAGAAVYTIDVTFNVTDCNGNPAAELSCDALVTVEDNTAPTWDAAACANIGASALTTITADASCQQTMPDLRGLALAELTENCDVLVATDITQSPAPGSPLTPPAGFDGCGPAGAAVYTIDVTFNVTDCNGNPAAELSCDALVTVEDNTAPTWDAAACANIGASALTTITADASCQQTMPDLRGLALAELTENCDVLVATDITQSPAPGSPLTPPAGFDGCGPAGAAVYTIDVTFNVTDCNGNPAAELSCDALVTVEDNTAPTWDAAACANIGASALTTITADASCQQTMPDLRGLALAELTENCDVLVATDITQSPAPGSPLTPPAGFDGCGPAGAAVYTIDVTFNVTDCNGNPAAELSCDALVTVEDNTAPTWDAAACANIGASALTTITADASCQQTMPDLRGLALAELTENCDVLVATDITQSPAPGSPLTPPAGFDGCGPAGAAVYTIDVTFNVTDCNGNPAAELSCDALVTVEDNTAPTWDAAACANIGASALTTITADASCQQTMPDLRGLALAELTENCDVLVATDITQSPAPGSPLTPPAGFDGCGPAGAAVYTIDVTFNVTDCNGNPAAELSCDALVTVEDNTAPTWDAAACANIGASALTTITADASCQQTMPDLRGLALAELTENCDVLVATDITQSPAPGSPLTPPAGFDGCGPAGAAVYTIDVTFNVTDCNGNPAAELSCDALVTVEDNTAPTWDAAACANIGASALTTITADASCQQTMPDLRGLALAELTENCDVLVATDITQSPAPGSPLTPPAGFDGCGPAGAAVYTIDVTFNVTDCNGNPAAELSCDALVTVEDNTAPTWDAAACANIGASALTTITADASCQQTMPDLRGLALAELTENCDVLVATDITQSPAPGSPLTPPAGFDGCGPAGAAVYTIDVTFNVTDCNGNPAAELSCDALVTVEDNTAPTWDAAACANIGASALTTITADASCQQTMPDLRGLALAELTENCDVLVATDITQSPAPGSPLTPPAGFDGCGPAGAAVYTIDVTFNVTDCNGNPAAELSCDALVTVEDNTAPTWDAAACANIGASALTTITADASCQQTMPDLRGLALAELTENCDVLVATDITQSPAPGSPLTPPAGFDGCGPAGAAVYTIDVTFNVTDCNGNPAAELSCDALVTVEDNTAPTWDAAACANIGASALTTITADASCQQTMPDLRGLALAELTENCDVLVATDITQSPAPGSPLTPPAGFDGCGPAGAAVYTIDVTFNVTDCNGNPAAELSCDALVTVEDNTAPTWDAAACANIGASALTTITADASCEATMPDLRALALLELTENCDAGLVFSDIIQIPAPGSALTPPIGFDGCGPDGPTVYTIDVTFDVTDCNGNLATQLACDDLISVEDNTELVLSTPDPLNDIQCDADFPEHANLTAADNCATVTIVKDTLPFIVDICAGYTVTYRWIATDNCGNADTATVSFDVLPDTEAPPAPDDANANQTVSCPEDVVTPTAPGDVLDNCGGTISPTGPEIVNTIDQVTCNGMVIYTWTYTDCANNTDTYIYTYTVAPEAIVLSCPDNISIDECPTQEHVDTTFANWIASFGATGGCNTTVTDLSALVPPPLCGGSVTVDFVATDDCNQSETCQRIFRISNTLDIQATCPANETIGVLITQDSVNTLFEEWLQGFGYSAGSCGVVNETDLSGFAAPSIFGGGTVDIEYIVSDDCSADTCNATFRVIPLSISFPNMGLTGPEVICPGNADFIYNVTATFAIFDMTWSYTGDGGYVIEESGDMVEFGFASGATEGYVIAEIGDGISTLRDSMMVTFADPQVCNIFCQGILDVSTFMMVDPGKEDIHDYWGELMLTSDGTVPSHRDITFNSGNMVVLHPNFEVEDGAIFSIYIESCDGIGFQDEEEYQKAMRIIKELLKEDKK